MELIDSGANRIDGMSCESLRPTQQSVSCLSKLRLRLSNISLATTLFSINDRNLQHF